MVAPADPRTVRVLGLDLESAVEAAHAAGVARGRAREQYTALFREGRPAAWMRMPSMPVVREEAEGATVKFAQLLEPSPLDPPSVRDAGGSLETESVILPQQSAGGRPRVSLCVSSQVGCAMGCTFCETARMGRMRQLSTEEIIAQWFAARHQFGTRIDNIVFMGMGEPMDNLDAVLPAIEILAGHHGPAIAPSRITVSTVGKADGIRRYADFASRRGFRRLNLAVSLNAPNDEIRDAIMPINRAVPMDELFAAMRDWVERVAARILIEYVLIPGVNDGLEHADQLVARLGELPATVNVIPYNPRRDSPWPAPEEATVIAFTERVAAGGRLVKRRRTMGRSLMGACGQLGNPAIRSRRFVSLGESPGTAETTGPDSADRPAEG